MARHHMHRQVYGHKTRLATDIMTTRALRLAIAEGILPEAAFRVAVSDGRPQVDEAFLAAYLRHTDDYVLDPAVRGPGGLGRPRPRRAAARPPAAAPDRQHLARAAPGRTR